MARPKAPPTPAPGPVKPTVRRLLKSALPPSEKLLLVYLYRPGDADVERKVSRKKLAQVLSLSPGGADQIVRALQHRRLLVLVPNRKEGKGHQPNTLRLVRQELWRLANEPEAERYTGRYLARVATWAGAYDRGIRRALREAQKGRLTGGPEKVWKLRWQAEGQNAVALAGLVALDAPAPPPAVASAGAASTAKAKKKTEKERRTERKVAAAEQERVAKQLEQRAYEFCRACLPTLSSTWKQADLGSAACLLWWQDQSAGPPKLRR